MMLAHVGHDYPAMVTAIGAENFCSGMGKRGLHGLYDEYLR